jgi:hypothetical protein
MKPVQLRCGRFRRSRRCSLIYGGLRCLGHLSISVNVTRSFFFSDCYQKFKPSTVTSLFLFALRKTGTMSEKNTRYLHSIFMENGS